jgi:hypothetical protein
VRVNQVLVAWDDVRGDPQWYHQDFILTEKRPLECDRALPLEDKPEAKPNPFKIADSVRLRDGTFTNGTVRGILVNQLLVAWDNVRGDPQWYHQDFISMEKKSPESSPTSEENQVEQDIVDHACRLVAAMDDNQRRRFVAYIQETYK